MILCWIKFFPKRHHFGLERDVDERFLERFNEKRSRRLRAGGHCDAYGPKSELAIYRIRL